MYRKCALLFCQDLLPAVSNPPSGKHPLQEEDLQGRFHRHLQPRGPAHRLRAAGGEQHDALLVHSIKVHKQLLVKIKLVILWI